MSPGAAVARAAWFAYWDLMRMYHRFEVRGLAHVERAGPALIVGYHGRPVAHDLCMLQALLHERRSSCGLAPSPGSTFGASGRLAAPSAPSPGSTFGASGRLAAPSAPSPEPRPVIHEAFGRIPGLRWLVEGVGFVTGDGEAMARTIARGDPVIVTPGGTREGCRSSRDRYRVAWGDRVGYLKLALRYKLNIIPTAAAGVDDTYIGLNDGYAWGKRLRLPAKLPAWIGLGPLGLWPLSPPFPVKIVQYIGQPINLEACGPVDPSDRGTLLALHRHVMAAVQALLDEARGKSTTESPNRHSAPSAPIAGVAGGA